MTSLISALNRKEGLDRRYRCKNTLGIVTRNHLLSSVYRDRIPRNSVIPKKVPADRRGGQRHVHLTFLYVKDVIAISGIDFVDRSYSMSILFRFVDKQTYTESLT
jgi:hypothetical protein